MRPILATANVITTENPKQCVLKAPISDILGKASLCFGPESIAPIATNIKLLWQAGAMAGLLAIIGVGLLLVYRAGRDAEQLSSQKTAFVSSVSHELRTPLTTLRMHAEMLAEGLVEPSREHKVHEELVSETVRLSRIVDNVLQLSRIEEGKIAIRKQCGDLTAHVRSVLNQQRPFVEAKHFTLLGPTDKDFPDHHFDPQAVEHIIVNLVDNAVKYASGSDPQRIEVDVLIDNNRPTISVRDYGPGIPPDERLRVFDRFYRVDQQMSHSPGTGIGLSLVAELAQAHGGEARVAHLDGPGTLVQVSL